MARRAATVALLASLLSTSMASAAREPTIRAVRVPHTATVGLAWRATLAVTRASVPSVVATGPVRLSARGIRVAPNRFRVSLVFPQTGRWTLTARAGRTAARLGQVVVDLRPTPLLRDVFALGVESGGTLLVGQVHGGGVVRATNEGRTSMVVPDVSVFHLSIGASGAAYVTLHDNGGVYRVGEAQRLEPLGFPPEAAIAVEARDGVYVFHGHRLLKRDELGRISTVRTDLSNPLGLTVGPDGALYIAEAGSGSIRRLDTSTGAISTVARELGYVVSVAVAPDGTIWSSSVAEGGRPGVWRTRASGSARIIPAEVSAVALGADGAIYVCAFRERRILRIDPTTGRSETILRSG